MKRRKLYPERPAGEEWGCKGCSGPVEESWVKTDFCKVCCKDIPTEKPIEVDWASESDHFVFAVRAFAMANYEKSYGWSSVVECWEDIDIAKVVEGCTTEADAIKAMNVIVEVRDDQYLTAVGPLVKCKNCGEEFHSEQICDNCDRDESGFGGSSQPIRGEYWSFE